MLPCQAETTDPFFECKKKKKKKKNGTGGSGGYRLSGGKKSMKKHKGEIKISDQR